jgi:C_GCAxxG_C_C family probable redox protein
VLLASGWLLGLEDRDILRAATGLGGGIGHEGDTCGALTGGILSLGLYHRDNDDERLWPDCIEYYQRFNRRFGSSKCRNITGVRFKDGYDIRRFFLKGIRCLSVVYTSIESVFDMMQKPAERRPLKVTYRIKPPFNTERFQCASAVLSRIKPRLESDLGSISTMARGFSGGIGFQGDVCGALMGGVLALGIAYGTQLQRRHPTKLFRAGLVAMKEGSAVFENEHLHPSFRASSRVGTFYRQFVRQFGSADCAHILDKTHVPKNRAFCEHIAQSTAESASALINV